MEEAPALLPEYSLSFGKWSVLKFGSPHSSLSLFSFKLPRIFSVPLDHWFTNFKEHQSVLEVFLKHSSLGPTLWDDTFLTNFQVILMLLRFGDHILRFHYSTILLTLWPWRLSQTSTVFTWPEHPTCVEETVALMSESEHLIMRDFVLLAEFKWPEG